MKHLVRVVVLVALYIGISAFGAFAAEPVRILASTFPVYQIVRNIVQGSGVQVELLLPAQMGCPHDYALSPQDMRKLVQADIFIVNGLGLEEFLGSQMERIGKDVRIIDGSRGIAEVLNFSEKEGEEARDHDHEHEGDHAHSHDHEHDGANPHIFASPRMAAKMAQNIAAQLSLADPEHATLYKEQAKAYADRLLRLADAMASRAQTLHNRHIITQHGVFDYLARDLDLEIVGTVQEHPGQEPSAARMLHLVRLAKSTQAGALFAEPQYPQRTGEAISREAGIPFAVLDPVATGPENAPLDYFEHRMLANMATLEQALGRK